ncbi:hypothetical protein BDL97_16G082400 [Sphagnum fallax]|nr:hypothetical protein BDL97_16G082400 [Sphagnum fallax]
MRKFSRVRGLGFTLKGFFSARCRKLSNCTVELRKWNLRAISGTMACSQKAMVQTLSSKRKALPDSISPDDAGPSTPARPKTKKTRKAQKETDEKRMAKYISKPSIAVKERIQRAFQHRLYVIEKKMISGADSESPSACDFFVLGATGNVYTVKLNQVPSCSCPDAAKGNTCKHLLFVMLRVLKLPQSDPRVWQKALLSTELEDLLNISTVNEGIIASQRVRQRFHEISGGGSEIGSDFDTAAKVVQRDIDGDCPICYEKMVADGGKGKKEPIVFCKACGNNVHRDCFERWSRSKRSSRGKVTCIYCRAEWVDDKKEGHNSNKVEPGGYVNLASYSENHGTEECSLEALYPDSYEWLGLAARRRQSRS